MKKQIRASKEEIVDTRIVHKPTFIKSKTLTAGITLIALVITIIVLLILAAVSIATLTGENGILNQAGKAKDKTEEANAKEQVQIAVSRKL